MSDGERASDPDGRVAVSLDPHVHSEGSYDAAEPVERILERAAAEGLDGIAVTDHDVVSESLRAADLAPEYGLVGIPGVEVSTADGHLLALGVEAAPAPGRPLDETVAAVRRRGGVSIVPHPFQRCRHGAPADAIDDPDAIEVYNAHTLTGLRNRQARSFAARRGLPGVGGSDAHVASLIGRAATEVLVDPDRRDDPEAILAAVREGRTVARGRRTSTGQYLRKYATNAGVKATAGLRAALTRVGARTR